jgi:hypothetical protein
MLRLSDFNIKYNIAIIAAVITMPFKMLVKAVSKSDRKVIFNLSFKLEAGPSPNVLVINILF